MEETFDKREEKNEDSRQISPIIDLIKRNEGDVNEASKVVRNVVVHLEAQIYDRLGSI